MTEAFRVTHESLENGVTLVKAVGRLDAATVPIFEQALQQLLAEGSLRLVVNLSDVNYISSGGLRVLITARRQARASGGEVLLCCMSPRVRQVFDMIGFSAVFGVFDQVQPAVEAFAAAPGAL